MGFIAAGGAFAEAFRGAGKGFGMNDMRDRTSVDVHHVFWRAPESRIENK
jgi:hypothetical protein